jgi:uridine kinase
MIIEKIRQLAAEQGELNVVIAGLTCSGKSTLAQRIQSSLDDFTVTVIHQDDYYRNLSNIPSLNGGYLVDSINAFCRREFAEDARHLLTNGEVLLPRYFLDGNIRLAKDVPIMRGQVNVFEGLHAITLLAGLDNTLKVFVDTPVETCLARRIKRDTERGIPETAIRQYFDERMLPMAKLYILPQKTMADVVVKGGGENER